MKTIKTDLFEITVADVFQHSRIILESVRAECSDGDDFISIGVCPMENAFYAKYKGHSLKEQFINFCLERRGSGTLQEERTISVDGYTTHVCTLINETGYFFYFAMVCVDDVYSIDFVGDCESHLRKDFLPLFEESVFSIRVFGNIQDAAESQKKGINDLLGQQEDTVQQQDTFVEPEIFEVPQDGKEYFRVDDKRFSYLETSEIHIPIHGNTGSDLVVTLKACIDDYDEQAHGHILNDYEDGAVYFTFSLNNIYQAGIPQGVVTFEKDYDLKREAYLWKGGFKYNLELFGRLVLRDGWVGMNGYFQTIMEDARFSVSFAKKIPLETLAWEHYHFSSLAELFSAPVTIPHHLRLRELEEKTLPEQLYGYTALESFSITLDKSNLESITLEQIPSALAAFTKLKELVLSNLRDVKKIPEELNALQQLRSLFIMGTQATSIPEDLLSLPQLEYCSLSNNRLEVLPAHFSQSIKSLSLEGNQLRTVPASLLDLRQLSRLDISRNPLEALPNGIENIENLTLELEKKQGLLDYHYKGANGKGTVPVQETRFSALYDPELEKHLNEALGDAYWTPYKEGIKSLALASVALETTHQDNYANRGNTRFGGLPDLPEGINYPVFTTYDERLMGYQFIAQLNCAELAPYQDYLPRIGILYFFITDQENFKAKVIYAKDTDSLQSANELEIDEDFIYDDHGIFAPYQVRAASYPGVPHFYSDDDLYVGEAAVLSSLEEAYDQIENLRAQLEDTLPLKSVHSINSYVFKQHDSPQIEAANQLRGNARDFMVLLRVSSDRLPGFCFWDAGEIYFVIHKSDLAQADFSNVYCGLESS